MSARYEVEEAVYAALGEMPERAAISKMLAALAVIEEFTTDNDTRSSARRSIEEVRGVTGMNVHRGIIAARDAAGQCAAPPPDRSEMSDEGEPMIAPTVSEATDT